MNLSFSPNGRIDQPIYWRAIMILFVLGAALTAASAFILPFLSFFVLIFIWPWIAVHVKRFHDSREFGWLTFSMVGIAFFLSFILGVILPDLFGVNIARLSADMAREITDGALAADLAATMSFVTDAAKRTALVRLLPDIAPAAIITVVIGLLMGIINKADRYKNKYGPAGSGA